MDMTGSNRHTTNRPTPPPLRGGYRKLSPDAIRAAAAAERHFAGLPAAVPHPARLAKIVDQCAAAIGLPAAAARLLAVLFDRTQPQDWKGGDRPIVWPSNDELCERLQIGVSRLKQLLRLLRDHGLIAHRDSPNGRRWGQRDEHGRIVEAYGIDLAPTALRYEEMLIVDAQRRAERSARRAVRSRVLAVRRELHAGACLAAEAELTAEGLQELLGELLVTAGRFVAGTDRAAEWSAEEWEPHVCELEARTRILLERLGSLVDKARESAQTPVKTHPVGPMDSPHKSHTKDPTKKSVHARQSDGSGRETDPGRGGQPVSTETGTQQPKTGTIPNGPRRIGSVAGTLTSPPSPSLPPKQDPPVRHSELLRLYPRLALFVTPRRLEAPTHADIVDAGDYLRRQLGISQHLWGRACREIGEIAASIAVAEIDIRADEGADPDSRVRSPGGYLSGMLAKAARGQLDLNSSLFGRRTQVYGRRRMH